MFVTFEELEKQVKQQVRIIIMSAFPCLSLDEFMKLLEKDDNFRFMRSKVYSFYPDGNIPFIEMGMEREVFVLDIVVSLKDTLNKQFNK
ncbi:hypothetical protein HRD98_03670 [Enterococcus faecalis]|nr:hypothetical protein [Enterococcus faecalis]